MNQACPAGVDDPQPARMTGSPVAALFVADPPLVRPDVTDLQLATRRRLRARGLAEEVAVPTHGAFTLATALACLEAQYFLGVRAGTYLRTDGRGRRVVSAHGQCVIREPAGRTPEEHRRARERRAAIERGPRFHEELARELGLSGRGVGDALRFAAAQAGVRDRARIASWCRAAGYTDPVPWSACFVNACLMAGGLPSGAGWIGYPPAILERARSATAGWSLHEEGAPGDVALFDRSDGDPVVHAVLVRRRLSDTRYATIGGSAGGTVAHRDDRSTPSPLRIAAFARPPWHR